MIMRDFARHLPYAIAVLIIVGLCNYSMQAGLPDKNGKQQFDIQTLIETEDSTAASRALPLPSPATNSEQPAAIPERVVDEPQTKPLESFRPNVQDSGQPDELAKLKTKVDKLERAILIIAKAAGISKENPRGNFPKPPSPPSTTSQSAKYKTGSGSTGGGGSTGNTPSSVYYSVPVYSSPIQYSVPTYSYQQPTTYSSTTYSNCPGGVCPVPVQSSRPRVIRR